MPNDVQPELIQQAREGDRAALEQLLIESSGTLEDHIARRLPISLRSKVSVEDATQQALTQAFLKIDLLREATPASFGAWLKAIGERTVMGVIKAEGRQKRGGRFQQVRHAHCQPASSSPRGSRSTPRRHCRTRRRPAHRGSTTLAQRHELGQDR